MSRDSGGGLVMSECKCNYHLGMGPNLNCPTHGEENKKRFRVAEYIPACGVWFQDEHGQWREHREQCLDIWRVAVDGVIYYSGAGAGDE